MGRLDWLVREGDTPDEARIRTLGFPFALLFVVLHGFLIVATLQGSHQLVRVVGYCINAYGLGQFTLGILTNVVRPGYLLDAGLFLVTLGVCAMDMGNAAVSSSFRSSMVIVLLLDDALVFKRDRLPIVIITIVLLYQCMMAVESVQRYGLYEAGYWGTAGVEVSLCNCASPPCEATPVDAIISFLGVSAVFLGDFYFTKGFASGMRVQLRKVEACVDVTAEIVKHLAGYDVEAAEAAIGRAEDLPEELRESLQTLLMNLSCYRDYLPETLMQRQSEINTPILGLPPCLYGEANAAMVFTDIQSSTALWDSFPTEMPEALRIHNADLRDVAHTYQGYEVKVIGDAFMLAFNTALDAV
eukprot:Hpha_TRINITY_DN15119_c6_g6::TRINITY_DN15119_c6_g6_i1::g.126778::m.126778